MRATCASCQAWSGAADASMGLCRLHRDCHSFTATGRECWCPSHTPIDTPDISAQAQVATDTLEGKPAHIAIEPANSCATVETWGKD